MSNTSYSIQQGSQAMFNITAIDYDNHPIQTRVHVGLVQRRWEDGKSVTTPGPSTDVTTDASGHAQATLATPVAGSMEVVATATTPENRELKDTSWLWVMGSREADMWGGDSQQVQIITDKKKYAVGRGGAPEHRDAGDWIPCAGDSDGEYCGVSKGDVVGWQDAELGHADQPAIPCQTCRWMQYSFRTIRCMRQTRTSRCLGRKAVAGRDHAG